MGKGNKNKASKNKKILFFKPFHLFEFSSILFPIPMAEEGDLLAQLSQKQDLFSQVVF